ncbi:MAG TPA: hypothetical protein VL157_13585 [Gemmatimonadaceae bacterium]|jgi:hypothetical protein|nr:hypothetical protein [Gemmatimonadaceae bacterium]
MPNEAWRCDACGARPVYIVKLSGGRSERDGRWQFAFCEECYAKAREHEPPTGEEAAQRQRALESWLEAHRVTGDTPPAEIIPLERWNYDAPEG